MALSLDPCCARGGWSQPSLACSRSARPRRARRPPAGALLGTVSDTSGGAIPGATVTATETRHEYPRRATVTNESGFYTFANLPRRRVSRRSRALGIQEGDPGRGPRSTSTPPCASTCRCSRVKVSETVTVTSEVPALQTDRADTGRVIEGEQIAAMPLGFGRNFQGMLATVPGASRPFRPHSEFFNSQDSLSTNVNGQSRLANNVLIEGIDDNHKTGLLTVLIPSAEALETIQREPPATTTPSSDGPAARSPTSRSSRGRISSRARATGSATTNRLWAKNAFVDRTLAEERQKPPSQIQPIRLYVRRPHRS